MIPLKSEGLQQVKLAQAYLRNLEQQLSGFSASRRPEVMLLLRCQPGVAQWVVVFGGAIKHERGLEDSDVWTAAWLC